MYFVGFCCNKDCHGFQTFQCISCMFLFFGDKIIVVNKQGMGGWSGRAGKINHHGGKGIYFNRDLKR